MTDYSNQIFGFLQEVEEIMEERNLDECFSELEVRMEQTENNSVVETLLTYNLETTDQYEELGGTYFSTTGTYSATNEYSLAPNMETLEEALEDNFKSMSKKLSQV